jgi:hypothetical protein
MIAMPSAFDDDPVLQLYAGFSDSPQWK